MRRISILEFAGEWSKEAIEETNRANLGERSGGVEGEVRRPERKSILAAKDEMEAFRLEVEKEEKKKEEDHSGKQPPASPRSPRGSPRSGARKGQQRTSKEKLEALTSPRNAKEAWFCGGCGSQNFTKKKVCCVCGWRLISEELTLRVVESNDSVGLARLWIANEDGTKDENDDTGATSPRASPRGSRPSRGAKSLRKLRCAPVKSSQEPRPQLEASRWVTKLRVEHQKGRAMVCLGLECVGRPYPVRCGGFRSLAGWLLLSQGPCGAVYA